MFALQLTECLVIDEELLVASVASKTYQHQEFISVT